MESPLRGILLLLPFFLLAAAEIGWKRSTRYVYQYESMVLSAIPELNSEFTGLGVRGKLVIEVGPAGKRLICQVKNPEVGHTDPDVSKKSSLDTWKRYVHLNYASMPKPAADPFTQPFIVEMSEGMGISIETPQDEPTWSVNMKKGIASQLTINLSGSNKVSISSSDSLRTRSNEMNLIHALDENPREFFAVEEDAVEGKCKTLYTVSPLPEVLAQKEESDLPPELRAYVKERPVREGESAHIVTKVRDFSSCDEKSYYYMDSLVDSNPGSGNPSDNQYKMFTSRSAITRYLIRGDVENFRVEKTWAQGEFVVRPHATETEKLYTITNQTLTLLEMDSPSKTQIPDNLRVGEKDSLAFRFPQALKFPDSGAPVKSHEPFFPDTEKTFGKRPKNSEYDPEKIGSQLQGLEQFFDDEKQEPEDPEPSSYEKYKQHHHIDPISYYPKEGDGELHRTTHLEGPRKLPNVFHYIFPGAAFGTLKKPDARSVVQQVEFLIEETAKDLMDGHDVAKRGTALKALEISRAMTILDTDELAEVFQIVLGGSTDRLLDIKKALALDCMVMAGTEPALLLVIDLVQTGKITGEQAIQLISTIPTSFKTNSLPVLKKLMDLVEKHANDPEKLESEYHKRQLWVTSVLTMSRMVTQICLSSKIKAQNHPNTSKTASESCDESSSIVTSRLLPYLEQELQNAHEKWKKVAILQALSNVAHPHVVNIVSPYIHASAGHVSTDIHIRSKAVYALNRLADVHPHLVFKVLKPVYTNFNDHYEIRMSAFSVIMKTMPPVVFWQEAATLTWFEPSSQVASFVYSTIATLANATSPDMRNVSSQARMALPLAKPQHLGMHYSRNYLIQNYVREKQFGASIQLGWFGSEESIVPRATYFRFANNVGGFSNDLIEVSLHGKGIQSAFNNFFLRYFHDEKGSFSSFWNKIKDSPLTKQLPLGDFKDIVQKLKLDPRADESLEGSISVKFFGQIERLFTIDTMSIRQMITQAVEKGSRISGQGVDMEIPVSWHKILMLPSLLGMVPSPSGLPTFVAMKRPLIISVTGTIGVQIMPPKAGANLPTIWVKSNLNPTIAANNLITTGTICPITNEMFASGVEWHASRSFPHNVEFGVDTSQKKIKFQVSPYDGPVPKVIRFAHVHQRPFITRKHILDFTPIPISPKTHVVQVEPYQVQNTTTFGEDWIGVPIVYQQKLDSPFIDFAGLYHLYETYGLSTLQLIQRPHTLRKLEYSVYIPVAEIGIQNISATVEYFEGDKECGISGAECDKDISEKFYSGGAWGGQEMSYAEAVSSGLAGSSSAAVASRFGSTTGSLSSQIGSSTLDRRTDSSALDTRTESSFDEESGGRGSGSSSRADDERGSFDRESGSSSSKSIHGYVDSQSTPDLISKKIDFSTDTDWSKMHNERAEKLLKLLTNPNESLEDCREKICVCKDVLEAHQASRSLRSTRDHTGTDEEDEAARFNRGKVRGINLRLAVDSKSQGTKVSQITVSYVRSTQGVAQKFSIQGELNPVVSHQSGPYKIFVSGKLQYPTLEATQLRKALLDNPQAAKAQIEIKYGPSLASGVTADIAMSRSSEQTEVAQSSAESHQCDKDESRGQMYSTACLSARRIATNINKYVIKLRAEQPTPWLRNMTYKVDDLLKYVLYPHMSNNRLDVENPKDSVTIVLNARPPQEAHPYTVLDAYVFKPEENTFFKHIKMHPALEGLFPLNSKMTFKQLVEKKLFKDQFFPMCKLEIGTVRTFDNVTYEYPLSDCYHVIAKDCSQNVKVAVLAREKNGAKTVKIVLGKQTIVISPEQGSRQPTEVSLPLRVEVNGQELNLQPTEHKSLGDPKSHTYVKLRRDLEVEVQSAAFGIRVISSGKRFKVQMSNMYRGRTCGLCGDMNGEKTAEYRAPSDCVYMEPESFARSYALITRDCHLPPAMHKASGTSGKCVVNSIKPLGLVTGYQQEDISVSTRLAKTPRSCITYTTKVVKDGDELCFSVKPLPECSLECKPKKLITKRVGFHCLPNSPTTTAIMAKARYGVVESLLSKKPHITHHVSIPESCQRIRN